MWTTMNRLVITCVMILYAAVLFKCCYAPVPARLKRLTVTGTCASINYSNSCCPPRTNCRAIDGNCECGADCHRIDDCCEDAYCPKRPQNCKDVGITSCCNNTNGKGLYMCKVHFRDPDNPRTHCACNMSCHQRNDCCPDAEEIGCIPDEQYSQDRMQSSELVLDLIQQLKALFTGLLEVLKGHIENGKSTTAEIQSGQARQN